MVTGDLSTSFNRTATLAFPELQAHTAKIDNMAARLSRSAVALRHVLRASSTTTACRLCASRSFASSTAAPKTKPSKQAELLKAWQQCKLTQL